MAGQHEILAESFMKENYKNVHEQAKKLKDCRKLNAKEYQRHSSDLKLAYKAMGNAKEKFKRAYEEQDKAGAAFKTASSDGAISKNEIKKLSLHHQMKTSQCDVMKANYADMMLKANAAQNRYYNECLPSVLNELQKLEQTRISLLSQSINEMIAKDREVNPIIQK